VVRYTAQSLGWILLAIASLWLAIPLWGLLTAAAAIVPGLGSAGAYCAGAVGVALALIAWHWIVRREVVVVHRGVVAVTRRGLFGGHAWREPLANYREIHARLEEQPHRYGLRRWHVIELWHPEPAKTIELARTRDPGAGSEQGEVWAGRLALPLRWQPHEHPARSEQEVRNEDAAPGLVVPAARSTPAPDTRRAREGTPTSTGWLEKRIGSLTSST
jgi:hypothetical protein